MVQLDRDLGKNYADNLVDYLLTFNTSSNWTVSSGTGSATMDFDNPYTGVSSLKLNNNSPTTNLVVSNNEQSTVIPFSSKFQISAYIKKEEALKIISGAILIYKNGILLSNEIFSIGSEVIEKDINNTWVRFQSNNNYSLNKNDIITFQFRLNGISGTQLTETTLWIDGIMINDTGRKDFVVPAFAQPERLKQIPLPPSADGNYKLTVSGGVYTWTEIV